MEDAGRPMDPQLMQQLNLDRQEDLRQEQMAFPLVGPFTKYHDSTIPSTIQWNPLLCLKANALFGSPSPSSKSEEQEVAGGDGKLLPAYAGLREVRRDGNCFIRGVLFRSLELLLLRPDLAARYVAFIDRIAPVLCTTFSDYVQDFCDVFRELVIRIQNGVVSLPSQLHAEVCSPDQSEYLIFFFRFVISDYIRKHADIFSPYIVDYTSVEEYCNSEVEAVSKECEQIHVTALCNAMNMPIVVQYVDLSPGEKAVEHVMEPMLMSETDVLTERFLPEGEAVHLLYRPGHYDILYPNRPA